MRSILSASSWLLAASLLSSPIGCQESSDRIPVLVVTGANNHDWQWTSAELKKLLEETGRFTADVTDRPGETLADAEALGRYRAVVLDYNGPRWGEAAEASFLEAVRGGLGVAVIHAANNSFVGWKEYEELIVLMWRTGETGHGQFHPFDVAVTDREHPITRDMPNMQQHPDELYHKLVHMHDAEHRVLARAMSSQASGGSGDNEPMIIVRDFGEGRVFHTPLGHVWRGMEATRASYGDPQLRRLIARGTEWAATGEVTLPAVDPNTLTAVEKAAGFRLLFDGKTAAGWRGYGADSFPDAGWVVEDGCLVHHAKGGGGDIVTEEQFGDFELRFEWAVADGANSGVIYRCSEDEQACWLTGPEYQILDDARGPEPLHSSAALYGLVAPSEKLLAPVGEFNEGRIVLRGRRVEHWLNGVIVVGLCDDRARLGRAHRCQQVRDDAALCPAAAGASRPAGPRGRGEVPQSADSRPLGSDGGRREAALTGSLARVLAPLPWRPRRRRIDCGIRPMPIDQEFIDILRSPDTRQPLRRANSSELDRVNELIGAGGARNRGGEAVQDPLTEGLVPEGESVIYPIRDDIPILLTQEAIPFGSE